MYLDYYQLTKEPFYITPDPEFLFLSESHKQAMANTVYGIGMKKGLMVITGDIGVGKTMVAQALLAKSDTEYLKTIYIDNANVTFIELLQTVCQQLELTTSDNVSEMINTLHQFLLNEDKAERTVALFIDDAHNMLVETLDNLVVLSNLETKDKKLLQIVLLGQPKLETLLNRNELRHIKQRVAIRATITALTPAESLSYVQHRLEKAGAKDTSAFTKTALKRILKEANGVPRVINMLCDNALVTAFGRQTKSVTSEAADEAITDLMGTKWYSHFKSFRWQTGVLAAAMCLCIVLFVAFRGGYFIPQQSQKQTEIENNLQIESKPTPSTLLNQSSVTQSNPQLSRETATQKITPQPNNTVPTTGKVASRPPPKNAVSETAIIPIQNEIDTRPPTSSTVPAPKAKEVRSKRLVKIKVKAGDSFIMLIKDFYGRTDKGLLAFVKSKNSHIQDFHNLRQGSTLYFPKASDIPQ
jgi:general secretion pathway protein A